MAKVRRTRVVLGVITRADGVRVEVRNPTVWKLLNEQAATTQAQQQVLESLKASLAKIEAERDEQSRRLSLVRRAFDDVADNWWVNLGALVGVVRLREVPDYRSVPSDTEVVSPPEPAPAT